jgi:hypothetical protein
MGGPMALNALKKAGVPVVVYDPNPAAMAILTEAGAIAATSAKDEGDQAEIVADHQDGGALGGKLCTMAKDLPYLLFVDEGGGPCSKEQMVAKTAESVQALQATLGL